MEKSGFFNANLVGESYDREYLAQDFAEYFASFIGNGVFPNPSTGLQIMSDSGRNISMMPGEAWINGYWYSNIQKRLFTVDPADGTLNRIDAVAIQLNYSERTIKSIVVKGVPAENPSSYVPQRTSDVYELIVAYVKVNKGSVNIIQTGIVDTRLNNAVCGIVYGAVQQVDTSTIFNQFQTYYNTKVAEWNNQMSSQQNLWNTQTMQQQNAWTSQIQNQAQIFATQQNTLEGAFMQWWQEIKDIISGDPIGNLLVLIEALRVNLDAHIQNQNVHVSVQDKLRWNNVALDVDVTYGNSVYTVAIGNQPDNMPEIVGVRFVAPKTYISGEKFKLGAKEYIVKNGYFEAGDVVVAQMYKGVMYFSSASVVPANRGSVNLVVNSYNGTNLNRQITYRKGTESKLSIQLDTSGAAVLDLEPGAYTFVVASVPSGYKKPPDQQISVVGGGRINVTFFMDYLSVDADKSLIVVDVSTFNNLNKNNLQVNIGGTVARTDASGRAQRLVNAYSSGQVLEKYTVSVVAPTGYKAPEPIEVTAKNGGEVTVPIFLEEYTALIYGVKIPKSDGNPASLVYTDDAVGMAGGSAQWWTKFPFNLIKPLMFKNGTELYDLMKTDITKKADGSAANLTTGGDGDAMVYFPQIWINIDSDSQYVYVKISDTKVNSSFQCYQDMRAGAHKGKHYIGCFKGKSVSSKLCSISGVTPTVTRTIAEFRSHARAKGAGYEINTFYNELMLECLFLIFYKTRDAQTAIGRGYVGNGSAATGTGTTNALGGGGNYGSASGLEQMKFLWIEDWYGNVYELIDGLTSKASSYYTTYDPTLFNDAGTNYTQIASFSGVANGYISDVQATNEAGFLPKATAGSETTYYCDYSSLGSAEQIAFFGGSWNYHGYAGAFYWCMSVVASHSFFNIGARLCFV